MGEDGWKVVYQGSGAHLERVIKQYKELGYEVKPPEEVQPSECSGCTICFKDGEKLYRLKVRKLRDMADEDIF